MNKNNRNTSFFYFYIKYINILHKTIRRNEKTGRFNKNINTNEKLHRFDKSSRTNIYK